jgi:hypothetical protein
MSPHIFNTTRKLPQTSDSSLIHERTSNGTRHTFVHERTILYLVPGSLLPVQPLIISIIRHYFKKTKKLANCRYCYNRLLAYRYYNMELHFLL